MSFWSDKRVLVTGGGGFLGSFVLEKLRDLGCKKIDAPRSKESDLRDASAIEGLLQKSRPDILIHLAAICGGIEANRLRPGTFFYDNAIMGIQLIEKARQLGVGKSVVIGTICAYPKFTPVPFKEDDLWNGYPEETNAPYGLAKKMLLVQLQAYRQQYGFNAITLLPVNLYGPGDNFDPESSHVIPALLRKAIEAKESGKTSLDVWGTGTPSREFLYVDDAAQGIALACEHFNKPEPVNLGSGQEITIRNLVELICEVVGFDGAITWDPSKPDGQPRRCLDTSRAKAEFGFVATTEFRVGLKRTLQWYLEHRHERNP